MLHCQLCHRDNNERDMIVTECPGVSLTLCAACAVDFARCMKEAWCARDNYKIDNIVASYQEVSKERRR